MYKGSDHSFSFAFFPDNKTTKESFGLGGKLLEVLVLPHLKGLGGLCQRG